MYKVFFNDRKIIIAAKGEITLNKSNNIVGNLRTRKEVEKWFLQFVLNDIQEVVLMNPAPGIFFKNIFQPVFSEIQAAGGVVFRKNKMLFIYRNKKWDLPKGKIERGELASEAALREVEEECGISGHKIIKQLPSSFHIYKSPYKKSKGEWIFKETFWFEMEYVGTENGTPQAEENITEVRWFRKDELNIILKNTYSNLRSIISFYK